MYAYVFFKFQELKFGKSYNSQGANHIPEPKA